MSAALRGVERLANTAPRADLRIVDTSSVLPHEIADRRREQRIEGKLREEGVLRDPLMVGAVPDLDHVVLLDGTNRQRALTTLGLSRVMVQVVDYADPRAVQLHTWGHAARLPLSEIARGAEGIPGLRVQPLAPLEAPDALMSPTTLAVLLDSRSHLVLVREPGTSRVDQLRGLVDLFEPTMTRVDCRPDEVEEQAHAYPAGTAALVAFPRFSRSQVVAMAMEGARIPAGITRHIILHGRALRVNLPLDLLGAGEQLAAANEALRTHVHALQPRYYREPTILFDS